MACRWKYCSTDLRWLSKTKAGSEATDFPCVFQCEVLGGGRQEESHPVDDLRESRGQS